jgi:hypothetical protein
MTELHRNQVEIQGDEFVCSSSLQIQNEQLTSILKKVEGESQFVSKQIETMQEKGARLQEVYSKLAKSLEYTEQQVVRAAQDHKALAGEQEAVDRANMKVEL